MNEEIKENKQGENIKKETPEDILKQIKDINKQIINTERNYVDIKYKYETDFLNLKYCVEYEKYKTIKEKEERAKIETSSAKHTLARLKTDIKALEMERDLLMLEFNYYSTVGGCCGCND